jgi:hypothetical protein
MFCGMPPSHAGSLARDCERSDPVVGDFSISGTVLVAFARFVSPSFTPDTRAKMRLDVGRKKFCLRMPFSQRSAKRGYPQQCVREEIRRKYNAQVIYCC